MKQFETKFYNTAFGYNMLTFRWYNMVRVKRNQPIISEDEWNDFVKYLKSNFERFDCQGQSTFVYITSESQFWHLVRLIESYKACSLHM